MVEAMEYLKSKTSSAVPIPAVPTNEPIYQVATETGTRTLWLVISQDVHELPELY